MSDTRSRLLERLAMYQDVREAGDIDPSVIALVPIEEVLRWLDEDEAADPLIREQIAAEIEAYATTPAALTAGAAFAGGLTRAARIARGTR